MRFLHENPDAINRHVLNNNLSEIAGGGEECVRQVYVYIIEKKPGSIDIIRDEICNVMGLTEGDRE